MPDPKPVWVSATIPKRGNRAEENEDALSAAPDGLRFAVADGATEGWESGPWARRLVACFTAGPPAPTTFDRWLTAAREWAPPGADGPVPWYAEEKRAEGSFAALVGLELRHRAGGWAWRAVAVGDSCLLHVRGSNLVVSGPLTKPEQFGVRPQLVPSTEQACPEPEWFAGRAAPGDVLLLASDAAAAHLFRPAALAPFLAAARDPNALYDWCRSVQSANNDDVTVLAITLPNTPEPS